MIAIGSAGQPAKLPRPFRLGLVRGEGLQFRRIATVGVIGDGGIWITPSQLPGMKWCYGMQIPNPHRPPFNHAPDPATVEHNVKLHYHRSGFVYPTLSGTELPRRGARFPGLLERPRTQIMSLTASRTWEFPLVEPRRGDAIWHVRKWPDWFLASFAVHLFPRGATVRTVRPPGGGAAGLLDGDSERYVVDLSGYGIPGVLSIRFATSFDRDAVVPTPLDLEPTVSLAAFSWSKDDRPRESFGLWSANTRNPSIPIERDPDLASIEHFIGSPRTLPDEVDHFRAGSS
ncbi:hypothetical protein [Cellulosimicrobium funkei]|uniref:hypothetical protein n=1 Tax=Cellulosimicrobium funkei TaxID=264251 RepID=UPI00367F309B